MATIIFLILGIACEVFLVFAFVHFRSEDRRARHERNAAAASDKNCSCKAASGGRNANTARASGHANFVSAAARPFGP